ncbi:hypothetical protein PORCAN_2120 [Porphyromonas crevioricanis JCM 13913]|nr:hypothetical protein PORCAN_2120 [Porphyromonas crevioricanis JCM 13913]
MGWIYLYTRLPLLSLSDLFWKGDDIQVSGRSPSSEEFRKDHPAIFL